MLDTAESSQVIDYGRYNHIDIPSMTLKHSATIWQQKNHPDVHWRAPAQGTIVKCCWFYIAMVFFFYILQGAEMAKNKTKKWYVLPREQECVSIHCLVQLKLHRLLVMMFMRISTCLGRLTGIAPVSGNRKSGFFISA